MNDEQQNKIIGLLEKISANQELQLERQKNALEMQSKAVAMQEDFLHELNVCKNVPKRFKAMPVKF